MKKLLIVSFCLCASVARAETYWVSSTGEAAWVDCIGTAKLGASACSLDTANANASAGDLIYLRGGNYTGSTDRISPANSGDAWNNMITYEEYPGESVIITGQGNQMVYFSDDDYIKLKGINFQETWGRYLTARNGSNNIWIEDCVFDNRTHDAWYEAIKIIDGSNWVWKNCTFDASDSPDYDEMDFVYLDITNSTHHVFDGCTFGDTTHASYATGNRDGGTPALHSPMYTVFINCIFENKWHSGLAVDMHRVYPEYYLIQYSTFRYGGTEAHLRPYLSAQHPDSCNSGNMSNYGVGFKSIWRFNKFYENEWQLTVHNRCDGEPCLSAGQADFNTWIYHNTLYDAKDDPDCSNGLHPYMLYSEHAYGLVGHLYIMNNIFSEGDTDFRGRHFYVYNGSGSGYPIDNVFSNNIWHDSDGEPQGTWNAHDPGQKTISYLDLNDSQWSNNSVSDPRMLNPATRDFSLHPDSPAIDAAAFLATISAASDHVIRVGAHQVYAFFSVEEWGLTFYDGLVSDTVYDDDGNSALITDIDYSTGDITLNVNAASAGFEVGDKLTVVNYSGAAPDIGAHEYYNDTTPPAKPTGLIIIE